jgi:hypothetical protein
MAVEFKETLKICVAAVSSKINFVLKFSREVANSSKNRREEKR